jgi:THO complex subunit 5
MRLPILCLDEYVTFFPDQAGLSEQDMMPLRIEHEKQEREKMEEQRLELLKVKEALLKENSKKKDELRKMDEKLEAMVDGLKLLEDALAKDV